MFTVKENLLSNVYEAGFLVENAHPSQGKICGVVLQKSPSLTQKDACVKKNFRCLIGLHNVPPNIAFEEHFAVFEGGICPKCGKLIQRKFIQNTWTEEVPTDWGIELRGFDTSIAKSRGYTVIPLSYMEFLWERGKLDYSKITRNG